MSSVFPINHAGNQVVNVSMLVEKPCPTVTPVVITYFQGSPIGWNAVLVGLLSSILAIIFLLTCIYYLFCRRRYFTDSSEIPTPVALVNKNGGIPVTSSQTETTTFINESGKDTKVTTYTAQTKGTAVIGVGQTGSSGTNGILVNGSADPSELHLLQHEHNN